MYQNLLTARRKLSVPRVNVMTNQTADYYGDIYQLNRTLSVDERDVKTEYYLHNLTNFVLVGLFTMLMIVTIVGNTLVIAAIITTRRLQSVTNCFVSSLATADLLVGLAVMPPAILLQLTGGTWEFGEILCDFWIFFDILFCTASILSLCVISIDRYLAVTQPLIYSRRRRSKRLARLMILTAWIMASVITCPPLLGCFSRASNRDIKKCSYNMNSSYVIFSAIGSFFLPMLIILYMYGRISCIIASRYRNVEVTNEGKNVQSHCKITIDCDIQQSCVNKVTKETKTVRILTIIIGGFLVCWLPFFILYLIIPFVPVQPPDILMPAFTWLGWVNSAINPFIYAFYSADFRHAFWRLICWKCSKSRLNLNDTRNYSLQLIERKIRQRM